MKGILGWLKSNLIIVICCVMTVVFLPLGYFFSNSWNKSIRTAQEEEYRSEESNLKRAERITYNLPRLLPSEPELSESRAPNEVVTAFYAQQRELRAARLEGVLERGRGFNRRDHAPLLENLFPEPPDDRTRRSQLREMAKLITGIERGKSIYEELFERHGIGDVVNSTSLAQRLDDAQVRQEEKYIADGTTGSMTEDQAAELQDALVGMRLNEYARRAAEIQAYGSIEALYEGDSTSSTPRYGSDSDYSQIPRDYPDNVGVADAFIWNWDYWIISDLLDAISAANESATGLPSIPDSVIKRILSIRVERLNLSAPAEEEDSNAFGSVGTSVGPRSGGSASPASFTGRSTTPDNQVYDPRRVTIEAIVSSSRLPRFLNMLAQTNLMTVTDLDFEQVAVWSDLGEGYYYGEEHVVRATIEIETLWLRSWLRDLMPAEIRSGLGVVMPEPELDTDG